MLKITISIYLTFMMFYKTHMNMLMVVVLTSFLMSYIVFLSSMNHWLMLMIILIFISGIMVLFMFIVSLSPNEKVPVKKKQMTTMIMCLNLVFLTSINTFYLNEQKLNSSYKINLIFLVMMLLIISFSAYTPTKMMLLFKGLKSSK